MSKRFTDTDIWKKQRWFRKLPPNYKLAFNYIKDMCNHAGIWRVDCSDLIDDLGLEGFDISDFISATNLEFDKVTGNKISKERLILLENNLLWVTGFVQYQYEGKGGRVNAEAAPVRTALVALEGLRIPLVTLAHPLHKCQTVLEYALEYKMIRLENPLREGWQTPKDKDKDKDRKGGVGEKQNGEVKRAVKVEDGYALFKNGKKQELGKEQSQLLEMGAIKPNDIVEGISY